MSRDQAQRDDRRYVSPMQWTIFGLIMATSLLALYRCGSISAKIDGYEALAYETLRRCEPVRDALGEEIGPALVGLQYGTSAAGKRSGAADWSIAVSGSRGRGTYTFEAFKTDGEWELQTGQLRVDGRVIDVVDCAKTETF